MAIPGLPFAALSVLLLCTVLTGVPFSSARAAHAGRAARRHVRARLRHRQYHLPGQPDSRLRGGRRRRRRARPAQDAGHRRCDVRPVGPHPPDRSAEPPGARSRRRGPGLAVVRVGGRCPDRLRQPPAADPAAVRLAGQLLHRARGPGRALRALPARQRADRGIADGGRAPRHGDRRLRDQQDRRSVRADQDDGLARRPVLRPR